MEKISSTDRVRNVEVLHRVKEGRNIVLAVKGRYDIGHSLRKNCFLKDVIEEKERSGGKTMVKA